MTCAKCDNKGYYLMMVAPASTLITPGAPLPEQTQQMMFCACPIGRDFRNLTIEFRLGDLEQLAELILPALSRAQANLVTPEKASKEIQAVITSIETMLGRIRKAFGETNEK